MLLLRALCASLVLSISTGFPVGSNELQTHEERKSRGELEQIRWLEGIVEDVPCLQAASSSCQEHAMNSRNPPEYLASARATFVAGYDEELSSREEETQPPSDDNSDGSDDSDLLPNGKTPSRYRAAFIILFTGTAILILAYFYYNPPRRALEAAQTLLARFPSIKHAVPHSIPRIHIPIKNPIPRSMRFRVSEGKLVRWAQEDMELIEDGSEEDTMVNASDDGFEDEYIPLRRGNTSGAWDGKARNYGSARFA